MTAVHKKHMEHKATASAEGSGESKKEPIIVSDVVTETTERIEVIEEVSPAQTKEDPLTDFKEKMSEEEEQPVASDPPQKNFMWPILFVFIIALALMGGIFIYKQSANKDGKVNVVSLSPTPTLSPKPTKAKIDLSKYEIRILNGSDVSGEAGRQKTNLEAEGFTISSVGNAAKSNYTETIIQAKKEVDADFLDKLRSVLEGSFTVGDNESLPETLTTPIVVILGTKK